MDAHKFFFAQRSLTGPSKHKTYREAHGPAPKTIRTAKLLRLSMTNQTKINVKAHGPAANSHCERTVFVTDKFDSQNEIRKA